MEHCKLQIGCFIILMYIAFIYIKECRGYNKKIFHSHFGIIILTGLASLFFDGATAYTVNKLDTVDPLLNKILHMFFLISIDLVIFMLYIYMLKITGSYPSKKTAKAVIYLPFVINIIIVLIGMNSLEYIQGKVTNYSMGLSVYTCFIMAAVYILLSIASFFKHWNYIESRKRVSILTYLVLLFSVTAVQMIFPETLISCIAVTGFILGIYLNYEDPALNELTNYHSEMVMSFANLIENRDSSTGGHIKRTSRYVQLITEQMIKQGYKKDMLTKDYLNNLFEAAPMHDIGKISIPDAILQKPGKLTAEEYEIMKKHSEYGGKIILESFKNQGNEQYRKIAHEVALYHHEKWNGKGYPQGLKGEEIPLSARIMAVADVFDAVSQKRCYRDAMPIDKCFEIISNGKGSDFDPDIADAFLNIREEVQQVRNLFIDKSPESIELPKRL